MKHEFEPNVDPWDLMVEHNQRIQRLEQAIKQLNHNMQEIALAINGFNDIQQVNRNTIDKLLDNQQQSALLMAQILTNSTPTATGQH
jgi:hypothetical protein